MRIAIITPHALPTISGPAVTAARLQRGLTAAGEAVTVIDASAAGDSAEIMTQLATFGPDVVHLIDAWGAGRYLEDPLPGFPIILQMPGSDIHVDIFDAERTGVVQRVMHGARAIVAAAEPAADVIRQTMSDLAGKVRVVPHGVHLGEGAYNLRRELGIPMSGFVFLLPGAITGIKNQGAAIAALDGVVDDHPNVHLVLAGPPVDEAYAPQILAAAEARAWCHHVPGIPHESMGAAYSDADVVVNTSLAEGGSNAVLEAMAAGRAVIVSAIPGNLGVVTEGEQGLTFAPTDVAALRDAAFKLIRDASLRQRLGGSGHDLAAQHTVEREIAGLLAIYEEWKGR